MHDFHSTLHTSQQPVRPFHGAIKHNTYRGSSKTILTSISWSRFNKSITGFNSALSFSVLNHPEANSIFDWTSCVEKFTFRHYNSIKWRTNKLKVDLLKIKFTARKPNPAQHWIFTVTSWTKAWQTSCTSTYTIRILNQSFSRCCLNELKASFQYDGGHLEESFLVTPYFKRQLLKC